MTFALLSVVESFPWTTKGRRFDSYLEKDYHFMFL